MPTQVVSRTWLGLTPQGGCWHQQLHFSGEAIANRSHCTQPHATVQIGNLTTFIGGGHGALYWDLVLAHGLDSHPPAVAASTVLFDRTFKFSCRSDSGEVAVVVVSEWATGLHQWSKEIRVVQACPPGVWFHLAVNVAPC